MNVYRTGVCAFELNSDTATKCWVYLSNVIKQKICSGWRRRCLIEKRNEIHEALVSVCYGWKAAACLDFRQTRRYVCLLYYVQMHHVYEKWGLFKCESKGDVRSVKTTFLCDKSERAPPFCNKIKVSAPAGQMDWGEVMRLTLICAASIHVYTRTIKSNTPIISFFTKNRLHQPLDVHYISRISNSHSIQVLYYEIKCIS